jgi:hypothetical protein
MDNIQVALNKIQAFKRGERMIVSGAWLDVLSDLDPDLACKVKSIPNPDRVGLLDQYVAWIG